MKIKISVVTVCFNAEKEIEETILSVVDQTYDNIEYIIIDGASTDGTVDIIKKYAKGGSEYDKHNHSITYWKSKPDKGIYDAMNKGIDIATGDYINFMNAGDYFVNNKVIENIFNRKLRNSDIIYGNTILSYAGKKKLKKGKLFDKNDQCLPFCHQSSFVKAIVAKKNQFNLEYKIASDYNFFFLLYKQNHEFIYVDLPISVYDTGGYSQSNVVKMYKEINEIKDPNSHCLFYYNLIKIYIKEYIKKFLPYNLIKILK